MFIVAGLLDAIAMIAVGIGLYFSFSQTHLHRFITLITLFAYQRKTSIVGYVVNIKCNIDWSTYCIRHSFVWFCVKFVWPPIINAIEDTSEPNCERLSVS